MRLAAGPALALALVLCVTLPGVAGAAFPWAPGGDPHDPATFRLAPGVVPSDFSETGDWKVVGTPDTSLVNPLSAKVNLQADELCGVRGMSVVDAQTIQPPGSCATGPVRTAWEVSTGRPDVTIAVLDSGIEWNNAAAMTDLRAKVKLNQGELPAPRNDLSSSLVAGTSCSTFRPATGGDDNPSGNYDVNSDGVFNVLDYACDSRVAAVVNGGSPRHARRHGPPGFLVPEDLILAFSDGRDHDHNGLANDIAGWNFVDDNNDPFDDVQYGHGTGEARDSNAEADNGGDVGTCPNCTALPLRVGESFVTDANRFAQAAVYATDRGVDVIQEALGTLNAPYFARQAIEYAYGHGVTVIASAADEAAEHHNQPGSLPDTIVVNSVTKYSQLTSSQPSYLQLNGCTNFSTRVDLSVPSSSCSSEATGKSAGVAGLIYAAAENAHRAGKLGYAGRGSCVRVDGSPCLITPNEVRQMMASGDIGSTAPGDQGAGQADDVNFAAQPEPSCVSAPVATCTDPNKQTSFAPDQSGGVIGPLPHATRYRARRGFDEFYGYGRLNAARAVAAAGSGEIPPQAEITSPDWFAQVDPGTGSVPVRGTVSARTAYRCRVEVAPGAQPNNAGSPSGDFAAAASPWCDGTSVHGRGFSGVLGVVSVRSLEARFPPGNPGSFTGNANGRIGQDANGRPNTQPYAFTIRVVVTAVTGRPMSGEDRRQLYLHRDRQLLPRFPIGLRGDGDSSPLLADINGDNRNELLVATSDGWVHAFRSSGRELPGWPVHTPSLPLHLAEPAYGAGGVGPHHYAAILGALAAGDLFGDGRTEVVADDNQGDVMAWDARGRVVFHVRSNPRFSGAPLTPFQTVRQGVRDRVERGFLSAPVLAELTGRGHGLDVIAAGEDRHVYAWQPNGRPVRGFPVLLADPDKVAAVDPVTNHITFRNVAAGQDLSEDQGKIIDTPAVASVNGHPVIFVGSNEEYGANTGDEGRVNISPSNPLLTSLLGASGQLKLANSRIYAIRSDGDRSGHPFLPGWPHKLGIIDAGLLPDVGEGVNGSPVVAPLTCPAGGGGMKVAVTPDAGPGLVLNADGTSCYGQTAGADNTLATGFVPSGARYDTPAYSALGNPAFGTLDGRTTDLFAPVSGMFRAIDAAAPEYQGGQDFIGAWNPELPGAQFLPGFPAEVNDLQFLTGPAVGQLTAGAGQQVIGATSSLDLAAFGAGGGPPSTAWPKLTADWTVATPTLGSFGTLDSSRGARKDVVSVTRAGELSVYATPAPACSPSSSPRFHHDLANSGDYTRDAIPPGVPQLISLRRRVLRFIAPGGDLLCGRAAGYQLAFARDRLTAPTFASARQLPLRLKPGAPGVAQTIVIPRGLRGWVGLRAIDQAGNVGLPAMARVRP